MLSWLDVALASALLDRTSGKKRQSCEPALRLNCKTVLKRNYMNHTINKLGKDGAECTIPN